MRPRPAAARNADAASPAAGGMPLRRPGSSDVQSMADAPDNAGRRQAIEQRLDASGIAWHRRTFKSGEHAGTEPVCRRGRRDGCAVAADRRAFGPRQPSARAPPTTHPAARPCWRWPNASSASRCAHHRVAIAFWDLEEIGLLGAKAYVADGGAKPALYVNFDVFGWGDTLWMMTPDAEGPLVADTAAAAAGNGLKLSAGRAVPAHRSPALPQGRLAGGVLFAGRR